MKKKKPITMNLNFEKCKSCVYFPDISVSVYDYYVDNYGVKHRDIKYICKYDLHEINPKINKCPRGAIDVK
jgi:hypothetical protein